jgi:hypothetical protein
MMKDLRDHYDKEDFADEVEVAEEVEAAISDELADVETTIPVTVLRSAITEYLSGQGELRDADIAAERLNALRSGHTNAIPAEEVFRKLDL